MSQEENPVRRPLGWGLYTRRILGSPWLRPETSPPQEGYLTEESGVRSPLRKPDSAPMGMSKNMRRPEI
jgi:hypothetical protein